MQIRTHLTMLVRINSLIFWFGLSIICEAQYKRLELVLATPNKAIFGPDISQFYMYTNRSFEGQPSKPWQGGKYGYVRNPKRTTSGIIYSKFHEGVDIRPIERNSRGVPLDKVCSIASGKVMHTSRSAGASNYGRYVVIEHDWGYGKFYSLYAHLADISCTVGQSVRPGTSIATLGYTGDGIDRTRAHLHLELNLMISRNFERWYRRHYVAPNKHGLYNGINLAGIDISGLYKEHQKNPSITLPQFIKKTKPYWKLLVPNKGMPLIMKSYPWLAKNMADATNNPSWEITMSRSGIPLSISPHNKKVSSPTINWVDYSATPHSWNTRSRLTGNKDKAKLTAIGLRFVQLLMEK
ncbi:MAG: M23 family metallopeptidase [Verrucomicrobiaceae bacterium]|nr:MAG: M23 family metallopeptidase [Verrucomicrobiaceae bacterium]